VKDLMLQPLASSAAVMSEQDIEAGIAILDIGGGTTDLAVFYEGILKHTAVIPFGGENITNDIKMGLGVLKTQAELMKVQYGSALADACTSECIYQNTRIAGIAIQRNQCEKSCIHHPSKNERNTCLCDLSS